MSTALVNKQCEAIAIRKILVPTDFSQPSATALTIAQTLAAQFNAKLHVAHVVAPEAYPGRPPAGLATVHDIDRARTAIYLRKINASNALLGIQHEESVIEGDVWAEIRNLTGKQGIDLIVAGTHGPHGMEKLVLGSVAEEIFRNAVCPVITVGPAVQSGAVRAHGFREILFPTDFSPQSTGALAMARFLASPSAGHLTMLHVAKVDGTDGPQIRSIMSQAYTERMLEELPQGMPRPSTRVDFGNPAEVIVQTSAALHSDLIVLGIRTGGELATHAPWTVASQVVRHAACPVLTVRSDVQQNIRRLQ